MALFGVNTTRVQRQQGSSSNSSNYNYAKAISSDSNRGGRYHRGLNSLTRLGGGTGGGGGNNSNGMYGSHGGTRGGGGGARGSGSASTNVAPRSVPRPLQTSSLKKENGGQDVTAVLVNRNNGE